MGAWIRIPGVIPKVKTSRGWSGYGKMRDEYTVKSPRVKAQNAKLREAAATCKGKRRTDFLLCMSEKIK